MSEPTQSAELERVIRRLEQDAEWFDKRAEGCFYIDRAVFKGKADGVRFAIQRLMGDQIELAP